MVASDSPKTHRWCHGIASLHSISLILQLLKRFFVADVVPQTPSEITLPTTKVINLREFWMQLLYLQHFMKQQPFPFAGMDLSHSPGTINDDYHPSCTFPVPQLVVPEAHQYPPDKSGHDPCPTRRSDSRLSRAAPWRRVLLLERVGTEVVKRMTR